jgi:hypothetical protein
MLRRSLDWYKSCFSPESGERRALHEKIEPYSYLSNCYCAGDAALGAKNKLKVHHHRWGRFVVISIVGEINQIRCRRQQQRYYNHRGTNVFRCDHDSRPETTNW